MLKRQTAIICIEFSEFELAMQLGWGDFNIRMHEGSRGWSRGRCLVPESMIQFWKLKVQPSLGFG